MNRFVLSFCLYKGLGLAHRTFGRSKAKLPLFSKRSFSDKNSTLYRRDSFSFISGLFLIFPLEARAGARPKPPPKYA